MFVIDFAAAVVVVSIAAAIIFTIVVIKKMTMFILRLVYCQLYVLSVHLLVSSSSSFS